MRRFSERVRKVQQSPTARAIDTAYRLRSQGVSLITLQNRLPVWRDARETVAHALEESWSSFYTEARGLAVLRRAIADTSPLGSTRQIDPETEVLVSVGARGAMFAFFLSVLDPGDEVLMPEPSWGGYAPGLAVAGARVISVPFGYSSSGFVLDAQALRDACTDRTKLVILNTPHNPTGSVFSAATLRAIVDLAQERDLFVLSDECYEYFVYDGARHIPIASLPGMFERTLTVSGASKTFNMFGWRIGWAISSSEVIERITPVHQGMVGCATSYAQAGAAAALRAGRAAFDPVVGEACAARAAMVAELNRVEGITCHLPLGAYFAFPNVSAVGVPSAQISAWLLERARVQTVPGSAFGKSGEGFLRVGFNCSEEDARGGAQAIARGLRDLRNSRIAH